MSIEIIDLLKPKNNGDFPIVEAEDVTVGSVRLPEALGQKADRTDIEELSSALTEKADKSSLSATNVAVAGKANASDVTTATANLQAQIDQIITPVTQDAEVQNARIGADGTSYTTLKERLDAEIDALTLFAVSDKIKIRQRILADNINKAISSTYNTLTDAQNVETSNIYKCSAGASIYARLYANSANRIVLATYDNSGNIIRRFAPSEAGATEASVIEFRYTFQSEETGFRVSHGVSTVGTNFLEFVVYKNSDKINAFNYVTPEMFGALGDGVTDDTAALQEMFDFSCINNISAILPKGKTYAIESTIYLRRYSRSFYDVNQEINVSMNCTYSLHGNNGSIIPNIITNNSNHALFCGEQLYYPFNNTITTSINMYISGVSGRVINLERVSLFKRITLTNESLMFFCKFTGFDVIFEGGTLHTVSEIKNCTFYSIISAFMTGKHRGESGQFSEGSEVGFLSDSKISNTYISGAFRNFPSMFIGTHGDSDALISGCFIESMKYIFEGGYLAGFKGILFDNCDIQYCYRLANKGIDWTSFSNTYFSSFSAERLLNRISWTGISDLVSNSNVGLICTDTDNQGKNTEEVNYKVNFINCKLFYCDNFITLSGGSDIEGLDFENSIIHETETQYLEGVTNKVTLKGKMSAECFSDTLNHIEIEGTPQAQIDGHINNAFKGQFVTHNGEVYYALLNNGSLNYVKLGEQP